MKSFRILSSALAFLAMALAGAGAAAQPMHSIQEYGVLPGNSPKVNKINLQKAIDEASKTGAALYVTPVEKGYPVESGLVLRRNVSLIGAHGPVGRGTINAAADAPVGSLFLITDAEEPFLYLESATQVRGIQFYYPEQAWNDPDKIIRYPATLTLSPNEGVQGVTLSCLTFFGEWEAMDFKAGDKHCEQIICEHCYGYPLSGKFISIDRCYDIPRLLHCHVNPANMRKFGRSFSRAVIDSVIARKTYTYWIDHTDNAVFMDLFTFGVFGGIYLGKSTYGQLTSFNLDCVSIGIYKDGDGFFNRDWSITNGSIIANCGAPLEDIHPFVVTGCGHTAIANVIAFSGKNGALTAVGQSEDFILVEGDAPLSLTVTGCRAANYHASHPITVKNPKARIAVTSSIDKTWNLYEFHQSGN